MQARARLAKNDPINDAVALRKARDTGDEEQEEKCEANVFVNVYDIVPRINSLIRCFCCTKWGIYHTGVQMHGLEIAFGGHDDKSTGVFCARPRSCQGARFLEQVPVGHSKLDPLELRQMIADISGSWPGNSYEPLHRNCNHFTDSCCQEIVGRKAPDFINKFSRSCIVKAVFYRCLVPLSNCLERYVPFQAPSISYADDEGIAAAENNSDLGIDGARGINQVLVEAATTKKTNANAMFKTGAYEEAREAYLQALDYLARLSHRDDEEEEVVNQAKSVRVALLLNTAACDLKMSRHATVLETCERVLQLDSDNHKALYRRGVALSHLGKLDDAMANLRRVLSVTDSTDIGTVKDIRREIERVKQLMEGVKEQEKSMAKRMLGGTTIGRQDNISGA